MADPQNMMSDGATWLASQMKQNASTAVTYKRGNTAVSVRARIGRTELETVSEGDHYTSIRSRDFIFVRSDLDALQVDGGPFEPEEGDRIVEAMPAGDDAEFEPMPMPGGQRFSWADAHRVSIRLHTKRVK